MRALHDEGVDTQAVARLDAPTTLGLVGLDAAGVPSYAFYGHGCADRLLPLDALAAVPAAARAFHFGSYAMVVEPVAATQRALVEREHGRSLIAYDPNIRLNVEPDIERWRDTLQWMLPRTHLLKVSEEDLGLLYPGRALQDLAARLDRPGRGLGGGDARRAKAPAPGAPRRHCKWSPVRVAVADTVGAGDTFQAALLTALAERDVLTPQRLRELPVMAMREVLEFASRAAAITCSRRGADLPRRGELG